MIKLLNVRASSHCLYGGDEVFVECTFEALADSPIKESVEIFCDFLFGHMNIPYNMTRSYRTSARIYPQPVMWKKGDVVTTGLRWKIPESSYGGSYGINIGLCTKDTVPISFLAEGRNVKRKYVGDIEVAFHNCAPKFVNSHRNSIEWEFEHADAVKADDGHSDKLDLKIAEVLIRDISSDDTIVKFVQGNNKNFKTEYAEFDIISESDNNSTTITLENVVEKDGYELLNVKFPTLISKKNSKMITTFSGGERVDSANSYSWGYEQKYQYRNVGILECDNNFFAVEAEFLDDRLHHSVYKTNGVPYASIGITFTYRMRSFGNLSSIKVINIPTVSVHNFADWAETLRHLRKDLIRKTDIYDRTLFYYYHIECDGESGINTFDDALRRVKELYFMTGGVKQVMLLRGWQHEGHDTGYPDVFTLNKNAGTMQDLEHLIKEALKYNAIVTFHDNYDDMYEENGFFESDIVAKDWNGNNFKSWIWVGGISNIVSFPKYYKSGKLQERVKKTLEMYPVKTSYHLDVLSSEVRRYDYSPEIHMAAQEVLEYKKAVVKEFEKYGITVTSEAVSQPFVGLIGHAWNILYGTKEHLFFNDENYPLKAMIYHGFVPYSDLDETSSIVAGSTIVPYRNGSLDNYKEVYFLKTLPIDNLCRCTIDDYKRTGDIYTVTYSEGAILKYDSGSDTIEITKDGRYLTLNGNTLVEGYSKNEYIGYTQSGKFKMKKYFTGEIAEITEISESQEKINYTLTDGFIVIDTACNTAFKIKT